MTPTKAKISESGFRTWNARDVAWTIEYPIEVMDEIRAFACNELLRLAHAGAEVAGVMFGSHRSGVIRILTWRPIACEYAEGEVLRLSHRDRMTLAVQLEVARATPELKDLRPVGWFVSHPNGSVTMTPSDLEVYSGFFPESAQVTLVIHPTGGGRAVAGFFVREADGSVQSDSSYQDFLLEPIHAVPAQAPAAPPPAREPARQETKPSESNGVPPNVPAPSLAGPSAAAPNFAAPSFAAPNFTAPGPAAAKTGPLDPATLPPIFETQEPLPTRERWLWAIPIALALGLAAWLLYQRQKPVESLPIAFHISSNAARTVQLGWNPNSRAIRDSDHGEIDITDDGQSSQVFLSSDQLHSGRLAYIRQSNDVGFQITVYPGNGDPVHETTRLIAPASGALPSQLPPAAGDDALQRQIRQLREDLRKERARADELQNLVRILEDRLGIQSDASKPAP